MTARLAGTCGGRSSEGGSRSAGNRQGVLHFCKNGSRPEDRVYGNSGLPTIKRRFRMYHAFRTAFTVFSYLFDDNFSRIDVDFNQ